MKEHLRKTSVGAAVNANPGLVARAGADSRGPENNFGIIPMPLSIEQTDAKPFEITADTTIVYQGEESKGCAEYLQSRIAAATGLRLAVQESDALNAIILKVGPEIVEFAEKDAYTFESNQKKITITGKSPSGLFYGVQTLFQLLPPGIYSDTPQKDMKLTLAALTIKDKPAMGKLRGLHVDIARHFRTKQELFKIIDSMIMHKLNTLHLHLTDSEGWRVEIKAYPKLTNVGAIGNTSNRNVPANFLTQEEIREICTYAKSRFVSIIPEIDMPGHIGSAIKAYPELKSATELRDPGQVMRIDEKGLEFCKNVLREVDSLFGANYIHIGCDEVNMFVDKPIYTDAELLDFVRTMTSFIKDDLKRTPIIWDDPFEKGFHDNETVVQWWRYGKSAWWAPKDRAIDEGLNCEKQPFIMSPAYWTYFDMPNVRPNEGDAGWAQPISPAELYNWDPFGDMLGVTEATRELALGAIACTWSESIVTMQDFGDRTFPRLASYAERTWRGGKSEAPAVLSWEQYRDQVLIPYQLDRYDALGVWYWSKDNPDLLKSLGDARKILR
jgi:hexosaminidase